MGQGKSNRNLGGDGGGASGPNGTPPPSFKKAQTLFYNPKGSIRNADGTFQIIKTDTLGLAVDKFFGRYELSTEVLGRGSYAEVRLATERNTGQRVAVKIMQKSEMEDRDLDDVRREVEILKSLDHENIVRVYDYYEDDNFVYVTMEYLSGGELYRNIDQLVDFTEKDTRDIMVTLIHALLYCKDRGIAHRDIKPENILLRKRIFQKKGENADTEEEGLKGPKKLMETSMKEARRKYEIALADFGFAIQVGKKDFQGHSAMETQCGTPLFIAPEIIQQKKYNYKCDIWSLGVICYMLLSGGTLPFPARSVDELYEKVLKGKWNFNPPDAWEKVSVHAKEFLRRLLCLDPKKRATYEELLDHQWFKDNSINKPLKDMSVNFGAMKKFNYKRKMLKALRARQAAVVFERIMNDLELSQGDDLNVNKYLKVAKLTDFYKNPQKKFDEDNEDSSSPPPVRKTPAMREVNVDGNQDSKPPTLEALPPAVLNSEYFKDITDYV